MSTRSASLAIAQSLGVSQIDASRTPMHAAMAHAEAQTHAQVVETLLARLGISPEEALLRVSNAAAGVQHTVDA